MAPSEIRLTGCREDHYQAKVSVFYVRSPLVLHHVGKMVQVKCDIFLSGRWLR